MKALLTLFGLLHGLANPTAATSTFTPDVPTFGQFVATCNLDNTIAEQCKGGVLDIYAYSVSRTRRDVWCDDRAFWRTANEIDVKYVTVLPWPDAVASIVRTPGVCLQDIGL